MSNDVKLTLEGTINESAVKKTGTLEGNGTMTIDVPDVTDYISHKKGTVCPI